MILNSINIGVQKTMNKKIKLSELEKTTYDHIINVQNKINEECKNSKDKHCNLLHTELIRNEDGILKEVRVFCKKQLEDLKNKKIVYNDLGSKIYDLDLNKLGKDTISKIGSLINDNKGIYISGTFGIGKTFLLYSLLDYLKNLFPEATLGYVDFVITFKKLCSNLDRSDNYLNDELINTLKDIDILIIDNLGDERNNKFILDNYVLELFNYRLFHNKTTIIASKFRLNKELRILYQEAKNIPLYLTDNLLNRIERLCSLQEISLNDKIYSEKKK